MCEEKINSLDDSTGDGLLAAMRAFQQGRKSAFDNIDGEIRGPVSLRVRKMGLRGDDCQEITQRVLVKVYMYAARATFKSRSHLWAWVYTITARETYKHWKKTRPSLIGNDSLAVLHDQSTEPADNPLHIAATDEAIGNVGDCIERLDAEPRLLLLGPLAQNLTFRQAATVHGLSLGQFKHRYEKALAAVRRCMKSKGYEIE